MTASLSPGKESSFFFAYCGVHYTTCPVEIRERFAKYVESIESRKHIAAVVCKHAGTSVELVPIATCNRFDLCVHGQISKSALLSIFQELSDSKSLKNEHLRFAFDEDATRMLFRIGSSLDSLVLGEPHILGQLKDAFTDAVSEGLCSAEATAVFNRCFQVAKRVRTETSLGGRGVSVGHAAVEVGRRVYQNLNHATVLIIGAGEMAKITAQHFEYCGAKGIIVANRSPTRAQELASTLRGAQTCSLEDLENILPSADIVVTATTSSQFIITKKLLKDFSKKREGNITAIVDISVPRNVDPQVGSIENVFLFDVDDLDKVMNENREARATAAQEAEKIIEDEVRFFASLRKQKENLYFVGRFHAWVRELISNELQRTARSQSPLEDKVEVIADALAKKLVTPVATLAKEDSRLQGNLSIGDALEQLFQLTHKRIEGKNPQ